MYNVPKPYIYPYWINTPMYNMYSYLFWLNSQMYNMYPHTSLDKKQIYKSNIERPFTMLKDYGPDPFVVNINDATEQNNTFRTALWTGNNLQVTLMSINVGDDIGLEVHTTGDQFIRIEEGQGLVKMGDSKDRLNFQRELYEDSTIMIPAGKWHNVINTGNKPLKLYAIYAPPEHPRDTVHETKADAESAENRYRY
ncbi:cupin domain-containing protein [uncultured Clostridium sp.]|uniref:cupin domain-containing protein n=1 Tax=uncultured Clostridium sp. TaxID=59620 RepID=UPI0025EDFC7E|nr:cupin domain-containing protein [uncultured Clostridium sp.]